MVDNQEGLLVFSLLLSSGPAQVPRLVTSVVVDPVERVLLRRSGADSRIEIGFESREIFSPCLKNLDPARPVSGVTGRLGVVAPTFHLMPNSVELGLAAPVLAGLPGSQTARAALESLSPLYEARRYRELLAAITEDHPANVASGTVFRSPPQDDAAFSTHPRPVSCYLRHVARLSIIGIKSLDISDSFQRQIIISDSFWGRGRRAESRRAGHSHDRPPRYGTNALS